MKVFLGMETKVKVDKTIELFKNKGQLVPILPFEHAWSLVLFTVT
jgi:predicted Zn-dependent protease